MHYSKINPNVKTKYPQHLLYCQYPVKYLMRVIKSNYASKSHYHKIISCRCSGRKWKFTNDNTKLCLHIFFALKFLIKTSTLYSFLCCVFIYSYFHESSIPFVQISLFLVLLYWRISLQLFDQNS